ncbi:MAG: signal peptidase I [Lachnospiraceae bacterium]|nr:signal peptidase I [Lachnospiraceae bacterium]
MNFRKKNELSKIQILKNIGAFFLRVIVVVAIGYSIVAFGGQTMEMVGESMAPVIHNDDILLVNKIKYKIFDPKQMDIILFKVRKSSETYYSVKRVIGVPGDTVQIIDGEVYVNDSKLENPPFEELILNAGLAKDPILLGEDEYFVMGDNCNISEDSRFVNIGVVLKEDIVGQIVRIVNPKERRTKLSN